MKWLIRNGSVINVGFATSERPNTRGISAWRRKISAKLPWKWKKSGCRPVFPEKKQAGSRFSLKNRYKTNGSRQNQSTCFD